MCGLQVLCLALVYHMTYLFHFFFYAEKGYAVASLVITVDPVAYFSSIILKNAHESESPFLKMSGIDGMKEFPTFHSA